MNDHPTICLAASGGGHVRQILDLAPLWQDYPHFFVTEDTALGRSIAKNEVVEFVPHFALGQARLGAPFKMLGQALASAVLSWKIIARRRPDVVITTGAGSQMLVTMWARLRGARIVLIDSFARFDRPSAFARLAGPLAHLRISQSVDAARHWLGAEVFDPLRLLDEFAPSKEDLVFATVGATLPFPRLVKLVLEARKAGTIKGNIVLQVGQGAAEYPPLPGTRIVDELPFDEIQMLLRRAKTVICHGGTGSIITGLQNHCHVMVVPRRFDLAEHYDDHQTEIATTFASRGLISIIDDVDSLTAALARSDSVSAPCATLDPSPLIERLRNWLTTGL